MHAWVEGGYDCILKVFKGIIILPPPPQKKKKQKKQHVSGVRVWHFSSSLFLLLFKPYYHRALKYLFIFKQYHQQTQQKVKKFNI